MSLLSVLPSAVVIPEDSGGPYVIAAYVVFLIIVVAYVAIMAQRLTTIARQADALQARLDARDEAAAAPHGAGAAHSAEASSAEAGSAEAGSATKTGAAHDGERTLGEAVS
jgi:uncharacterized membrane protein YcjF (UPF0283 family)